MSSGADETATFVLAGTVLMFCVDDDDDEATKITVLSFG